MKQLLFLALAAMLCTAGPATAQKRNRQSSHPRLHKNAHPARVAAPARAMPDPPVRRPNVQVPPEKGRTVISNQISTSGSVIPTPVPKPRKVVVVPAPPPPGGTTITAPGR